MMYFPGFGLAHQAMKSVIECGEFRSESFSKEQRTIIQKVFSDYLMYIWMTFGDTRCNREGYTIASQLIGEYFRQQGDKNASQ